MVVLEPEFRHGEKKVGKLTMKTYYTHELRNYQLPKLKNHQNRY
jgi:hypothetical protein